MLAWVAVAPLLGGCAGLAPQSVPHMPPVRDRGWQLALGRLATSLRLTGAPLTLAINPVADGLGVWDRRQIIVGSEVLAGADTPALRLTALAQGFMLKQPALVAPLAHVNSTAGAIAMAIAGAGHDPRALLQLWARLPNLATDTVWQEDYRTVLDGMGYRV
jgi:hypothetical protein